MFPQRAKHQAILLLTSASLPLLVQLALAAYTHIQRITASLQTEPPATVLARELTNWRTLVATLLALALPTYLITFHSASIFDRVKDMMNGYMSTGSLRNSNRSMMRKYKPDIDQETYNKVMKRGGTIGGLVNDGNTCFMNSVIQSLASSNTLIDLLDKEEHRDAVETKELKFIKSLRTLLGRVNAKHGSHGKDYRTNPMLKTMTKTPNKNFLLGYNQEDAQEFFQTILSELEANLKELHKEESGEPTSNSPEPSTPSSTSSSKSGPVYEVDLPEGAIIGNKDIGHLGNVYVPASQIDPNLEDANERLFPFNLLTPVDGLSAERIGCLRCGEMGGVRYSLISGLSLNLPADNYAAVRLTQLLDDWMKPEIIDGVDCNRCALVHVLEYQEEQLNKFGEMENSNPVLIEKFEERMNEIKHELTKPIIDDEVVKKLYTKNMMQKSSKSKQILISRPPALLSMHINRSVFDPDTFRVKKNGARVVFPLKLDLDHYVAEPSEINTDARLPLSKKHKLEDPKEDEKEVEESESETPSLASEEIITEVKPETISEVEAQIAHEEEIGSDDEDEEDEDEDEEDEDSSDDDLIVRHPTQVPTLLEKQDITGPLVYQLRSVIVHYGTHNYGHYIAYRKYRGVWWRTSDESIDIVDEDEVLSAPGVFMLFYELDSLCQELAKDEEDVFETTVVEPSATEEEHEQQEGEYEHELIKPVRQMTTREEEDNELIDDISAEQQALDIASL